MTSTYCADAVTSQLILMFVRRSISSHTGRLSERLFTLLSGAAMVISTGSSSGNVISRIADGSEAADPADPALLASGVPPVSYTHLDVYKRQQ